MKKKNESDTSWEQFEFEQITNDEDLHDFKWNPNDIHIVPMGEEFVKSNELMSKLSQMSEESVNSNEQMSKLSQTQIINIKQLIKCLDHEIDLIDHVVDSKKMSEYIINAQKLSECIKHNVESLGIITSISHNLTTECNIKHQTEMKPPIPSPEDEDF